MNRDQSLLVFLLFLWCIYHVLAIKVSPTQTSTCEFDETYNDVVCPTITDAINYANYTGIIELLPGVHKGVETYIPNFNGTIKSVAGPESTVIDMMQKGQAIYFNCPVCHVRIEGIHFTNGTKGNSTAFNTNTAVVTSYSSRSFEVHNCIFSYNYIGGILILGNETAVTITNCTFQFNSIHISSVLEVGEIVIDNCYFWRVQIPSNAINIQSFNGQNNSRITNSKFFEVVSDVPSAFRLYEVSNFLLDNLEIRKCYSEESSGILPPVHSIGLFFCSNIKITNTLFTESQASLAIWDYASYNTLYQNITFLDSAGAIYLQPNSPTVYNFIDSKFINTTTPFLGPILVGGNAGVTRSQFNFISCWFENNKGASTVTGTGIKIDSQARVVVRNSTFIGNSAGNGGAIAVTQGNVRLTVESSRFYRNKATTEIGNDIYIKNGTNQIVEIVNSSFQCSGSYGKSDSVYLGNSSFSSENSKKFPCLQYTIADQLAKKNFPFVFRYNSDMFSTLLMPYEQNLLTIDNTLSVQLSSSDMLFAPSTNTLTWNPLNSNTGRTIAFTSNFQTISQAISVSQETTAFTRHYAVPNGKFTIYLSTIQCHSSASAIVNQFRADTIISPLDWVFANITSCTVSGIAPNKPGLFYLEISLADSNNLVVKNYFELFVSNFEVETRELVDYSYNQTEIPLNVNITSISTSFNLSVYVFIDEVMGSFYKDNGIPVSAFNLTFPVDKLEEELNSYYFVPTVNCTQCTIQLIFDDLNGPIEQTFITFAKVGSPPLPTTTTSSTSNSPENLTNNLQSSSSSDIGAIVGGVLGSLLGLIIIFLIIFFFLRRKNQKRNNDIEMRKSSIYSPEHQITNVKILNLLGAGNFGEVYQGEWQTVDVALKKLKGSEKMDEFEKEVDLLCKLRHPHVLNFLGIYTDEANEKYLVTEFMEKGDLLHLVQNKDENLQLVDFIELARQAAAGMTYLSERKIVHRDLSLRNLLVTQNSEQSKFKYELRVADFGLSRIVNADDYYKNDSMTLPVKWSAPEALQYGKFSSQSDVWSFGVTMWELFSRGMIPYMGMSNVEATQKVVEGYRLPKPDECPDDIYNLIKECWSKDPDSRPTFPQIVEKLTHILVQYKTEVNVVKRETEGVAFNSMYATPGELNSNQTVISNVYNN